jgi:flagellar motor switch protein FliM
MSDAKEEASLNEWQSILDSSMSRKDGKEPKANADVQAKSVGIRAVLDKALQSYDKLPMLEIVFDRLVRLLTTSLRNLTSETVDVDVVSFNSLRFNNYIKMIPQTALITVFKAVEWENLGLLTIDSSLVFSMVDILFGGRKNKIDIDDTESRTHTDIEQALVRQISDIILSDLGSAFDVVSPITFAHDRLETNATFATIARPGDAAMLLQLKVDLESRGGKIDILIPYATLDPIRELLSKVFMGESFGADAEWEENLVNIAYGIDLPLDAIIISKPVTIMDVALLKVGKTIVLDHEAEEEILLSSSGVNIFKGQIGKKGDKMAMNITDVLLKRGVDV